MLIRNCIGSVQNHMALLAVG